MHDWRPGGNIVLRTGSAIVSLALFLASAVMAEIQSNLLQIQLLESMQVSFISFFSCDRGSQCAVRCRAGEGQQPFDYSGVKFLEIAESQKTRLVGIRFVDQVGKVHDATALLPQPSSCVFDDFHLDGVATLVEGRAIPLERYEDGIIDIQPER